MTAGVSRAPTPRGERPLWRDPRLLLGIALSALLTWLATRGIRVSDLARAFAATDVPAVGLALVLTFVILWLRALRWRLLLLSLGDATRMDVFRASTIGSMVNFVVPIRIGELVRAYLVRSRGALTPSAAFGTVVVERIADVFAMVALFAGVSLLVHLNIGPELHAALRASAFALLGIALLATAVLWALHRHRGRLFAMLRNSPSRLARVLRTQAYRLEAFLGGVAFTGGPLRAGWFVVQTAVIWLATVWQVDLVMSGMHLVLPWHVSVLVVLAVAIGVVLPSAPGLVGTFHYAAIVVLDAFGVPRVDAIGCTVVLHAISVLPVVAAGLAFAWGRGLSFGKLMRASASVAEPGGRP